MKRLLIPCLMLVAGIPALSQTATPAPTAATAIIAVASNTWKIQGDVQGVPVLMTCILTVVDEKITGTCTDSGTANAHIVTGTATLKALTWTFGSEYQGTAITLTLIGQLDDSGNKLDGTIEVDPYSAEGTFSATKQAVSATN